jgi:hypothetical protein
MRRTVWLDYAILTSDAIIGYVPLMAPYSQLHAYIPTADRSLTCASRPSPPILSILQDSAGARTTQVDVGKAGGSERVLEDWEGYTSLGGMMVMVHACMHSLAATRSGSGYPLVERVHETQNRGHICKLGCLGWGRRLFEGLQMYRLCGQTCQGLSLVGEKGVV